MRHGHAGDLVQWLGLPFRVESLAQVGKEDKHDSHLR